MTKKAFISAFFLLPLLVFGQGGHWEISAGGEYMLTAYNFRSPHNSWAIGADIAWWQPRDGYSVGLKAGLNYNPNGICGHRLGAAFMVRQPLFSWLDWEIGLGLSTYTRPLPFTGDSNNVYISTWITMMVDMGLSFKLDEHWHAELGLLHSSNGHIKRPNRGLNFFRLGVNYRFDSRQKADRSSIVTPHDTLIHPHSLGLTLSAGITASRHSMQKGKYLCYDLSLNYLWRTSRHFGMGATVDLWYNFSHVWQLPRYHDTYTMPLYVGAMYYIQSFLGPLNIRAGVGYTLLSSSRVLVPIYERLSCYYEFGQHYVGLGINAHLGQAEFVEWSYGFWIPISKR